MWWTTSRTPIRVALAGTFLLAACNGDSPGAPGTSVFEGEVTGAYSATLAGDATFGVTIDDVGNGHALALILGEGSLARILLVSTATPKPPPGIYEILPPGFAPAEDTVFTGTVSFLADDVLQQYEVRGGSITLTRSNHNAVTGQFELLALRTSPAEPVPAQIFIAGTFNAAQIPQEYPAPQAGATHCR
jgi:hypothetical protein